MSSPTPRTKHREAQRASTKAHTESLEEIIRELGASNEDLNARNEELRTGNEDLRDEDLRALNEELCIRNKALEDCFGFALTSQAATSDECHDTSGYSELLESEQWQVGLILDYAAAQSVGCAWDQLIRA